MLYKSALVISTERSISDEKPHHWIPPRASFGMTDALKNKHIVIYTG